jgi:hypothetical protein
MKAAVRTAATVTVEGLSIDLSLAYDFENPELVHDDDCGLVDLPGGLEPSGRSFVQLYLTCWPA